MASQLHPVLTRPTGSRNVKPRTVEIPRDVDSAEIGLPEGNVTLTNLHKLFWAQDGVSKRDLLQYYADIAAYLLPHVANRAMVMKRYPEGADGEFFFQKHSPKTKPGWIPVCEILHPSANAVDFPVVQNLAGLLWVVNLGCIDLNPWYARCDDVDRPDYLHYDLYHTPGADFGQVRKTALIVRDALAAKKIVSYPKTTGSRGIHVYVPIVRGPLQKEVWTFAKGIAKELEAANPGIVTAEYRVAKRPAKRVLVDYNQNAWGRTLASVYSVRPKLRATVSAAVTWQEVEDRIETEDFRIDNMPQRLRKIGDLYKPLLQEKGRVKLERFL
jgi:bifunctional non-homologous end joining protein LigD